jgi:hypothetical protein
MSGAPSHDASLQFEPSTQNAVQDYSPISPSFWQNEAKNTSDSKVTVKGARNKYLRRVTSIVARPREVKDGGTFQGCVRGSHEMANAKPHSSDPCNVSVQRVIRE